MRIGIDARMYSSRFTGIGRYVYELCKYLFEIDKKNEYVLFFNSSEYKKFELPNERVSKRLIEARHYSWDEQTKFLKILNQENIDLMHFTHFNAPLFYNKPSIVTIHDLTLSFFPGKKMTSLLHRLAYKLVISSIVKKSKKVIAVSYHTKKDLQEVLKADPNKIEVVYEAVADEFREINNPSLIEEMKLKYKIDKNYILYTGVWRSHKNLPRLIKAIAKLIKEKKFDGYLVITGREDPFYPEVKESVYKSGIEKNVIFTGLVEEGDLIALYNGASVYALPSLYEGFGLSLLESFACSVPVVASNAACIPEVCGKRNAEFFNPYDINEMAEKIFKVMYNNKLQSELIKRGKLRIQKFSWRKTAEETLKIYESAI